MRIELLKLIVTFVGPFATHVLALPEFGSQDTTRSGGQSRSASRFEARARDGLLSDVTAIIKDNPAVEGLLQNATAILYAIPTTFNLSPLISKGRKVIPDAHHPFIAPGPTDARGGCPGLNLMANYGYIPRNGITDMVTLLYAIQEVFGVGPDFALVLVALALKTSVDLTTLKMSIGDTDARTDGPLTFLLGRAPGLFSTETHNKYEVDGSLATDDAYFAGGRTTQFNGTRWATWYKLAETKYNGTMPIAWNGDVRFMQYNLCRKTNPKCHWAVVDQLVFYLAQTFISTVVPSSEANGLPGPALVDSVNQFMGIVKHPNGTFTRDGHSRLPPGRDGLWYRRTIPLTTLEMAGAGGHSLTSHLPEFGHNDGLGNWNADLTHVPNIVAPEIACLLTKSILDPKGTRFKGVALTALTTLLRFVLAPVQGQLSCK